MAKKNIPDQRKIALDYLEAIQRKSLENRYGRGKALEFLKLKKNHTHFPWDEFIKQSKYTISDYQEFKMQYESELDQVVLNTKFELPLSYLILKEHYEKIEKTAAKLSLSIKSKVFFGTAQAKYYQATALKVPETDVYLTIVESELFTLSNQLAKLIAGCLPNFKITEERVSFDLDKEQIKKHIKGDHILQIRFEDFVEKAIIKSQPNSTQPYFLDDKFSALHYALTNSLELFVVGHEYSHIARGHFEKGEIYKCKDGWEKIKLNWDMEYDADLGGLVLLINTLEENILPPFKYLGPELFFTFLDLAERVRSYHKNGTETRPPDSETHPPSNERKRRIRELLNYLLSLKIPQELEMYHHTSEFIENVMEELWKNYKSKKASRSNRS